MKTLSTLNHQASNLHLTPHTLHSQACPLKQVGDGAGNAPPSRPPEGLQRALWRHELDSDEDDEVGAQTLNPAPRAPSFKPPKPSTLNPKLFTPNPKP